MREPDCAIEGEVSVPVPKVSRCGGYVIWKLPGEIGTSHRFVVSPEAAEKTMRSGPPAQISGGSNRPTDIFAFVKTGRAFVRMASPPSAGVTHQSPLCKSPRFCQP